MFYLCYIQSKLIEIWMLICKISSQDNVLYNWLNLLFETGCSELYAVEITWNSKITCESESTNCFISWLIHENIHHLGDTYWEHITRLMGLNNWRGITRIISCCWFTPRYHSRGYSNWYCVCSWIGTVVDHRGIAINDGYCN